MIISMTVFLVNSPPVFDIPNVEPDGEFEARLEHVMLEGHLLEVTVSEMCTLWEFKQTLKEYKITKLQPVEPKVSFAFCTFLYTTTRTVNLHLFVFVQCHFCTIHLILTY